MRAFLSVTPGHLPHTIAMPGAIEHLNGTASCVVSHELSDHPPPGYLWGQDLRDFFALADNGHTLVGNVHADDLDEVRDQIVETCGVPENQFRAIGIFAFIWLDGGVPDGEGRIKDNTSRRYVTKVYFSDGSGDHCPVYSHKAGLSADAPRDSGYESRCRAFLEDALADGPRDIDGLRSRFLAWEIGA